MTEQLAARIRARLAATGKTANGASVEAGGSPSLIPNILLGRSRSPRLDTLRKIAEVLQTSVEYLSAETDDAAPSPVMPNTKPPEPLPLADPVRPADVAPPATGEWPRDLPVLGSAMGSIIDQNFEGLHVFSGDPVDYARRPPSLARVRDAYAIYVSGDSMDPMHPHGALRVVHPHRPPAPGDSVVVYTKHWDSDPGQGYIKLLKRRQGEMLILQQLNPPSTLQVPMKFVVSVHKVLDTNDLLGV